MSVIDEEYSLVEQAAGALELIAKRGVVYPGELEELRELAEQLRASRPEGADAPAYHVNVAATMLLPAGGGPSIGIVPPYGLGPITLVPNGVAYRGWRLTSRDKWERVEEGDALRHAAATWRGMLPGYAATAPLAEHLEGGDARARAIGELQGILFVHGHRLPDYGREAMAKAIATLLGSEPDMRVGAADYNQGGSE